MSGKHLGLCILVCGEKGKQEHRRYTTLHDGIHWPLDIALFLLQVMHTPHHVHICVFFAYYRVCSFVLLWSIHSAWWVCVLSFECIPFIQYSFITKRQYNYTRNVLWFQAHSSHIHINHKTSLHYNNCKHTGKTSFINKYMRSPTVNISQKLPLYKVYLLQITVLIKEVVKNKYLQQMN